VIGQPASSTTKTTTKANGELGKDDFLKLLVAQLRYQNPMSPTDPSSMMQQSVQFSILEVLQQIATNSAGGGTRDLLSASSMIGRRVTWWDGSKNVSGTVTGVRTDPADPQGLKVLVGKQAIALGSILEVADPAAPTTTPATTPTGTATTATTTSTTTTGTTTGTTTTDTTGRTP
jgi:flagellar basal-body rod modification protein FlgD